MPNPTRITTRNNTRNITRNILALTQDLLDLLLRVALLTRS